MADQWDELEAAKAQVVVLLEVIQQIACGPEDGESWAEWFANDVENLPTKVAAQLPIISSAIREQSLIEAVRGSQRTPWTATAGNACAACGADDLSVFPCATPTQVLNNPSLCAFPGCPIRAAKAQGQERY